VTPGPFIPIRMELVVMFAAERHRELIAYLGSEKLSVARSGCDARPRRG
jgi:hypothetical protein